MAEFLLKSAGLVLVALFIIGFVIPIIVGSIQIFFGSFGFREEKEHTDTEEEEE